VAGHQRPLRVGQLAVHDVQVGAADAAGVDANEDLIRAGFGRGPIDRPQR
jgi:hypothetical protein